MSELLGIIGGSGLYSLENLKIEKQIPVSTPYGEASSKITLGELHGKKLAFLARHGESHSLLPHEVNYRANIWALKSLGVKQLVGVSATGSLVADIAPGDISIVSQYIDFTKSRQNSFFGNGLVAHISTAQSACSILKAELNKAAENIGIGLHQDKTYVCVQGPRLGTRAESFMFKSWGAHLVGMTNVPEAFLAKEAQMAYCTLAVATDYDCWMDDPSMHVSVEQVISRFHQTIGKAKKIIESLCKQEWNIESSEHRQALKFAVLTPESNLTEEHKELLKVLRS